ncbi:MAG: ComEC/Rec2 family competence protein [Parvibaculaceae bacterium]|nr:ComEC/Rec2 family competence protein [Parvibaculaceae bacterium]
MARTEDFPEAYGARLTLRELPGAAIAWLRRSFAAESGRYFLWTPVFLGLGIASYFALPSEPPLWAAGLGLALAGLLLWAVRRWPAVALCAAALFCVALGFAAAVGRTAWVAAPVIERTQAGTLTARVVSVETTVSGGLLAILAPESFSGLRVEELPARVRLNIRIRDAALRPGATVEMRARLLPPPEPVSPFGFDFARQAWFNGLGAVGFAYSAPREIEAPSGPGAWLSTLRMKIGARIRGTIGGTSGAVAAALITGERASIPDEISEDLRAAGIYHVLAISGLHMVLFAGSLFWAVRAALALVPGLALRYPIKKWAAAIAILGATFYLLISGGAIATQRAWIMISLMFVAVLLDRPALSMRNVMLAAILVLLWRPESLIGAGFQMSFAAVIALIAFYESDLVRRWTLAPRGYGVAEWPRLAATYVLGIALTSIVAGAATGAIAAYHFNRIAVYGLAGNMAAMPVVGLVVMPMALLALLLMPFGLDGPALLAMGWGVETMLAIADEVAGWGGSDRMVPAAPLHALLLVTMGGLWMAIWRGHWRHGGMVAILLGFLFWGDAQKPDILIDRDASLLAARMADGTLALSSSRPDYAARQWLRYEGDSRSPREAARTEHMRCDQSGCIYAEPGRPVIAFSNSLDAVTEDCGRADIIVARVPVPSSMRRGCGASLLLDWFHFWRNGATAISIDQDGSIGVTTARGERGERPWVQRRGEAQ